MKRLISILLMLCVIPITIACAETEGITYKDFSSWVVDNSEQSCTFATAAFDNRTLFSMSTDQQNVIRGFTFENSDIVEYVQAIMKDESSTYIKSYLTAFSDKKTYDEKYNDVRKVVDEKTADLLSTFSSFWSKSTLFGSYYLELGMNVGTQALAVIWLNADSPIENKDIALSLFAKDYPVSETVENTRITAPVVQELEISSIRLRDYYNTKVFAVKVKNTSKTETVDAFTLAYKCYDAYDERLSGSLFGGASAIEYVEWWKTLSLKPRKTFSMGSYFWYLFDYQTCARIDVAVSKYHTKSDKVVSIPESEYIWVSGELK